MLKLLCAGIKEGRILIVHYDTNGFVNIYKSYSNSVNWELKEPNNPWMKGQKMPFPHKVVGSLSKTNTQNQNEIFLTSLKHISRDIKQKILQCN